MVSLSRIRVASCEGEKLRRLSAPAGHRPILKPGHPGASSRLKSGGIPKAAAKGPANPPHFAMPTVSIVVPCFNQEAFIAEALDSLLAQSYTDWECIVVNDSSTDGSKAIVDAYAKKDSRILSLTKENGGVAAACNFGFFQARGSLFVPLDGNDKIHPDYLKRAVECFEAFPNTVLVHTGTQSFGAKRKVWRSPEYSYEKLLWQNLIVNTTMYRREAFQRAGAMRRKCCVGSSTGNSMCACSARMRMCNTSGSRFTSIASRKARARPTWWNRARSRSRNASFTSATASGTPITMRTRSAYSTSA